MAGARRASQSGSIMVLFTMMLPTLLIPLSGLAIDASIARLTQIRLQAAVDGAALGAGRELGTAADPTVLAGEFLAANFRTDGSGGTWGAHDLTSDIVYTPGITKRIDVTARAQVPLLFMRIFGKTDAVVVASGSSTRSDSRVVFVIDRSGSMTHDDGSGHSTVVNDAINYTSSLVSNFIEGSDELGLVVFDGSAVVGYPSGTWTSTISTASTGGPNKTFKDGSATDILHQLALLKADNGTGLAEAISIAYIELQKAHMRDLTADGVDTRLNSIVLLSDGAPTAVSLYVNNPANTNANNIINGSTSGGGCANKTITVAGATTSNMMQAWISIYGNPPYYTTNAASKSYGLLLLATHDTNAAHTAAWWMNNGGSPYTAQDYTSPDSTPYTGCTGSLGNKYNNAVYNYFTKIPSTDLWGNTMTGNTNYKKSSIVGGAATSVYNGTDLNTAHPDIDYHWGLAMWNAADSAAANARKDVNKPNRTGDTTIDPLKIQLYVIGYSGNGGCDEGLLKRIANDKTADGYDSTQPIGRYYSASDGASLANAYNTLASDLLRLAR